MTITVTQVSNSQTFGAWLSTTNRLANIVSQNTVTTDATTGGSLTTGNGYVNGYFGANYVYVNNGLVGGNITSNGELLVLSNTKFQYSTANLFSITGNSTSQAITAVVNAIAVTTNTFSTTANSVNIASNTFTINVNVVAATVNTFTIIGNSTFSNTVTITGAATLSNTLSVTGAANVLSTFGVTGNATFANVITVTGSATLSNTISVAGAANLLSTMGVSGAANLLSTVGVTGAANLFSTLRVSGAANLVSTLDVTGATTLSNTVSIGGNVTFNNAAVIVANGSFGTNGQVLSSNGSGLYWGSPPSAGVTSVATGNGLTGGPITSTGTVSIQANNGTTANSSGLFVTQGTGTVVNSTGVHVNSSMFVNTSAAYTISGVHTYTANLAVNTATISVGNTTADVVVANTTGLTVSGNLTVAATSELIISNGAGIYANGGLGSNGQVLSSNGTGVYWANVASSGGGGAFNTNISNSVGFAANSTMSAAFTAPATSGIRYIVHSIHVTNIGAANTGISGEFGGTTYANVSFATTVPVPADSSVELLKMPKIMQPSDILRLQVDDNTALHATITYETQQNINYFGAGVDVTADATYTDLYTATGNAVLQSVLLSNDDGTNDVKARVVWTDGSNNIQGYYCYDLIVPADSTIEILEQPKFLQSGYKVRVYGNVGNRLEAMIAGKLI